MEQDKKLRQWLAGERAELAADIKWFGAGAKLTSPSGDDITGMKVGQLRQRLDDLDAIMSAIDRR